MKIIFLLIISINICYGQTNKIDSLKAELLKPEISERQKVYLLNSLGVANMSIGQIYEAKKEFLRAATSGKEIDIESIKSLAEIGNINSIVGESKAGLDTLLLALKYFNDKKIDEKNLVVARLYKYLGDSYSRAANYDKSLYFLMKSINVAKQINDNTLVAKNQNTLAINYSRLKDFKKAIESNFKALEFFKSTNEIIPLGNTYSNIATTYKEWNKNDSAIKYIKLAEEIYAKLNYELGLSAVNALKAEISANSGQEEKALEQYKQNIKLDTKIKLSNNIGYDYQAIGVIFHNKKQYDSANIYLQKALLIYKEGKMSKEIVSTYNVIVDNYIALKNVDSINKYLALYKKANEEFLNEEKIGKIAKNEVIYETGLKEEEIKNQKKTLTTEKKQKKWLRVGIGGLFFCCSLITIFFYKQFKRNKIVQKQKQEILHNNRNNIQQLISIFSRQSETDAIKENSIANQERLYTLNLLNKLLYENGESNQANVNDYLTQLGAAKEISSGKEVAIQINAPSITLQSNLLKDIGLIINELTTNSIKYAFAKVKNPLIKIDVTQNEKSIHLTIADNGNGLPANFNLNKQRNSFGLDFVKDLVEQHYGSIKTFNNSGACFEIELKC